MKLVVTEKNDAAQKIADLLGVKKPKADKVYSTPVYRFDVDGEEWVTIGLRGHILEPDFTPQIVYKKRGGWRGVTDEGETVPAQLPDTLPKPPFKKKKPFTEDGVELKSWKMDALPYLVYAPIEKLPKEKEIIRSLKNLAKKADSIVIATDFDREGELIGADALSCVRDVNATAPVSRARYSAFTKEEITHAFSNLVEMDDCLASAGASRQDIDLIWGAVLTRYLTLVKFAGYGNVRSSGRVQTPTLALIVARERERLAFKPEDYWVIKGAFDADAASGPTAGDGPGAFEAPHATARFKSEAEAQAVMAHVQGATSARVASIEKKKRTVAPPAPFNTTSLMAAASAEGLSPARTMRIAESLYMDGYISYPRVDNTVYPPSLDLAETVKRIASNPAYAPYCRELLAKPKLTATRGKKETTDHPPIYPTNAATPDDLPPAEYKLYNLVARRFLATLSEAAVVEGTRVSLDVAGETFVARGDVLAHAGFRAIYPYGLKKDEQLPALSEGQAVAFNGATNTKKQTEPPARYSQGKLIQEMEKLGLGTKSTRHSIIERLYTVKYIQNDPIEPSQLGMAVCDALDKFAPHITHPEMTAELEAEMDSIAAGRATKDNVVTTSRNLLAEQLGSLLPHSEEVKDALADAVAADAYVGKCPKCGQGPAAARVAEDARHVHRLRGLAGLRRDVPLAAGQGGGAARPVPHLRHAAGEGDGVPLQAAHHLHRPVLRDQPGARRGGGRVPCVQGGRQGSEAGGAEEPAHAEALHPLRELRGVQHGLPAAAERPAGGHGRGVRTLRCAPGDRDHRARALEALPELRLPRQGRRAGEEGRERRPRRGKARRKEGPCQKGPGQEAGREEALGSVGRCEKPR